MNCNMSKIYVSIKNILSVGENVVYLKFFFLIFPKNMSFWKIKNIIQVFFWMTFEHQKTTVEVMSKKTKLLFVLTI